MSQISSAGGQIKVPDQPVIPGIDEMSMSPPARGHPICLDEEVVRVLLDAHAQVKNST